MRIQIQSLLQAGSGPGQVTFLEPKPAFLGIGGCKLRRGYKPILHELDRLILPAGAQQQCGIRMSAIGVIGTQTQTCLVVLLRPSHLVGAIVALAHVVKEIGIVWL